MESVALIMIASGIPYKPVNAQIAFISGCNAGRCADGCGRMPDEIAPSRRNLRYSPLHFPLPPSAVTIWLKKSMWPMAS